MGYTKDYHFDLVGNRMTMDQKTYEYDEADRIKVENLLASRVKLYSWEKTEQTDKELHDTSQQDPLLEAATYLYDLRGRMNKVEVDENGDSTTDKTVTYAYNPDGFRVTKSDGSDTRHYVVASQNPTGYAQVLEEHVDGSGLDRSYTIGHTVLGQDDGTDALTFLVDGHNSTMALVTTSTTLDQRFAYDAYGSLLEGSGLTSASAANTNHLYTAEHFDADAQMQYLRARWYDPTNGRFNRLDPFAGNPHDPQSLHKYLYAHANPVMAVDPSGLLTLASLQGAQTIRSVMMSATRILKIVDRIRRIGNMVDRFHKAVALFDKARKFLVHISAAVSGGTPAGPAVLDAFGSVLGVNGSSLIGWGSIQQVMIRALEELRTRFGDMTKRVKDNASKIAADAAKGPAFGEIMSWAAQGLDLELAMELCSPPYPRAGKVAPGRFLPPIPTGVGKDDLGVAFGLSGHGGVFFGIGIGVRKPPSNTNIPNLEKGDYRTIVRVDYWDYRGASGYGPHYHIGNDPFHYPLK